MSQSSLGDAIIDRQLGVTEVRVPRMRVASKSVELGGHSVSEASALERVHGITNYVHQLAPRLSAESQQPLVNITLNPNSRCRRHTISLLSRMQYVYTRWSQQTRHAGFHEDWWSGP